MSEPKLAIATRIHLGKASTPPPQEKTNATILKFLQTSIKCNASYAVIAVDSEEKIQGYNLISSVNLAVSKAIQETNTTILHVIPVTPWGNFTPALNALISWCCNIASNNGSQQINEILFLSAETDISNNTLQKLLSHLKDNTLVVGVCFPGHKYKEGENELTGVTSPWNTAALWNLPKLALTGFPLVSEGLHPHDNTYPGPSGVEEVSAIALLQNVLGADLAQAKLIRCDEIEWETKWDDKEREEWHKKKMASKVLRPKRHLDLLGLSGIVIHC